MPKKPDEYLKHIQDEILFILSATEKVPDNFKLKWTEDCPSVSG